MEQKTVDRIRKYFGNDLEGVTVKTFVDGMTPRDALDPEKGLAMAISKKYFGNKGNYYNQFAKWLPEEETKAEESIPMSALMAALEAMKQSAKDAKEAVASVCKAISEEPAKKMTCREKCAMEHPEMILKHWPGGVRSCPNVEGYTTNALCRDRAYDGWTSNERCTACWDQEVEEK